MKNVILKAHVAIVAFAMTSQASAQQDLAKTITGDGGWIAQLGAVGLLVLAAAFLAGVSTVSYGIWYYIQKSDNPQEQDAGGKAMKLCLGGAALTIVPLFIGILSLTLGGDEDATNSAAQQLIEFKQ